MDGLTRAFADRYVGLLYSVCDELGAQSSDPAQRRAAQVLLADSASNVYDIASNADAFTRVLDLLVVMTLVAQEWDDDGKAVEVFGERGQMLIEALSKGRAEAWALANRVLTVAQLATLDSLLLDWRQENPNSNRASFVRFSDFSAGRGRSAADDVVAAGGLFFEVGEAGQAVDDARLLAERMFYRLKREATLLRWQAIAMKDHLIATPELNTALADLHTVTEQIDRLPKRIADEREAIFRGIDVRFGRADETVAKVRAALKEANTLVASLEPAAESLNEVLSTADALFDRGAASGQSQTAAEGRAFDIRDYGETAREVTLAAEKINEALTAAGGLLESANLRNGIEKVNGLVDGRIMTMAEHSKVLMNAFFWRACALLCVLFALMIIYRAASLKLSRAQSSDDLHAKKTGGEP